MDAAKQALRKHRPFLILSGGAGLSLLSFMVLFTVYTFSKCSIHPCDYYGTLADECSDSADNIYCCAPGATYCGSLISCQLKPLGACEDWIYAACCALGLALMFGVGAVAVLCCLRRKQREEAEYVAMPREGARSVLSENE